MKGRSICRSKCFLKIILCISDSFLGYVGVILYAILFVNISTIIISPKWEHVVKIAWKFVIESCYLLKQAFNFILSNLLISLLISISIFRLARNNLNLFEIRNGTWVFYSQRQLSSKRNKIIQFSCFIE